MSNNILKEYYYLTRFNKPIGFFLLLWPTLWALWLAGDGKPNWPVVGIFILGVLLMRSAGCVINDIADQAFDREVKRTRHRPLATKKISTRSALVLFFILMIVAFLVVLLLNRFTVFLAVIGACLAVMYPFLKRITHLPQFGLGLAFAWGIPMAFAAEKNMIPWSGWFLFATAMLWPIIYDTMYAMVDREDDIKIHVKSTAILFGNHNAFIIGFFQSLFLLMMTVVGFVFHLHWPYYASVVVAAGFFIYQQWLLKNSQTYFAAFMNNQWVGLVIFIGIVVSYAL